MRGLIGMLAGVALACPAFAQTPGVRAGGATMTVGHAAGARPGWGAGGWNGGGWNGGGVRPVPGGGFAGHAGGGVVGRPGFPGGYGGYRRPFIGYVVPRGFIAPTYLIGNWSSYGLASPASGYGWYRYYDDAVMVDGAGRVRDWRGGIDWDRDSYAAGGDADDAYDDGYEDGFDDGVDYAEDAVTIRGRTQRGRQSATNYGGSFGPYPGRPPAATYREDRPLLPPPPMRRGWSGNGYAGAPYAHAAGPGTMVYGQPGGATVVVVNSTPSVATTTTTTTTSWETVSPARVWHAPAKRRITKGKMLRR